jgi:hypothetical protein
MVGSPKVGKPVAGRIGVGVPSGSGGSSGVGPPHLGLILTLGGSQVTPTSTSPINFTATFSQAASGFANGDILFTDSTAGGTLAASVTGGPTVYNVAVSGMASGGSVIISCAPGAATSTVGSLPSSAATSPTVTWTGAAFDSATTAWEAAVIVNGGTVSGGRKTLVDNLIVGLKADGVWTKLDRLWILAAENTQSALTDLVATDLASAVNAPGFITDRGYTGNGSSSCIDTTYNPVTQGINYTLNSASLGAWTVTANTNSVSARAIGLCENTFSSDADMISGGNAQNFYFLMNDTSFGATVDGNTGVGCYLGSRLSSANYSKYLNGVASTATPYSVTSVSVPNQTFYLLARNRVGVGAEAFSNEQLGAAYFGGGLSGTDATNLYNRLRTYMTVVGVP